MFCVFCTCGLGELECILDSNLNTILIFSTKDLVWLYCLVSDIHEFGLDCAAALQSRPRLNRV